MSKWCWFRQYSDVHHGPFDTREDAVESLSKANADNNYLVARAYEVLPKDFIPINADDLLEQMGELFCKSNHLSTRDAFYIPTSKQYEARCALRELLEGWAEKYISTANAWYLDNNSHELVSLKEE